MTEFSKEYTSKFNEEDSLNSLRLEVHPSVVFKLGEDLITDDMQALIELVKNSYDADASRVKVDIDTQVLMDIEGNILSEDNNISGVNSTEPKLQGMITISDNGFGMGWEDIRRGWLTVSHSHKKEMKAKGETTEKKRTPLGDKGLGRLGAQRLGSIISLTTKKRGGEGFSDAEDGLEEEGALNVVLDWNKFQSAESLSSVPIPVVRDADSAKRKPGTTLKILGLRDVGFWKQGETLELQKELSSMISPYKSVSGFKVSLYIDDHKVNLYEATEAILSVCPVTYDFEFDGSKLKIKGGFRTTLLRPAQGRQEIAEYEDLIGRDNGHSFSEWLINEKQRNAGTLGVGQGDDKFFIHTDYSVLLSEVEGVEHEGKGEANPGPFYGEISSVPLSRDETSIFDKASEYREFARALVGVKVYRDGFGVRVDDDWLGLGGRWTSGTSYYGLRPGNVTGYVNISASQNSNLEETTNREAFRDTPAYRNFYRLLSEWVDYTSRVQEYVRRSYNEYRKTLLEGKVDVEPNAAPKVIIERANEHLDRMEGLSKESRETKRLVGFIRQATKDLEVKSRYSKKDLFGGDDLEKYIKETVSKVEEAAVEADRLLDKLDGLWEEQKSLKYSVDLLSHQVDVAESQVNDAWESVALGLSAELLSHEVHHISSGLRGRSSQITTYLKNKGSKDQRVWSFVEHVRSSASALIKQVSRLNPSLRYVRESKSDILLSEFLAGLRDYYVDKWGGGRIFFEVDVLKDFSVRINKGRLTQVFDNLVVNSEYWLTRYGKEIESPRIVVQVQAPYIVFKDNGFGVDPAVEELVFDPFVTLKPSRKGRGLGLFVVRQLLDAEGSYITLTPERNELGRRFEFRVNLSGCVV